MIVTLVGGMDPQKIVPSKSRISFDAWLRMKFIRYNPPKDFFEMPWYLIKVQLKKIINE